MTRQSQGSQVLSLQMQAQRFIQIANQIVQVIALGNHGNLQAFYVIAVLVRVSYCVNHIAPDRNQGPAGGREEARVGTEGVVPGRVRYFETTSYFPRLMRRK